MTITRLSATNLKVATIRHDLGPVSVCVGENFIGKSARLEAIRLALLGFVPGIAKTNSGVFSLSCGASMSVRLDLSDGSVIERSYVQKGETVKATERSSLTVPPCLLDAGEYLRLSERERIKMVFGLVDMAGQMDGADILAVLERTPIDCEPAMTEAVVLAKKAILDRLGDWDRDRHDCDENVQGWLEDVANDLRERVKTTNAALGRMEKFGQALTELRSGGNDLDAANVDRLLREKRLALQQAGEALAVARAKQDQAGRDAATRRELERRLSEPFDAAAIESTRTQIADLEKVQVEQVDMGDLAFKVAEARAKLEGAKQALRDVEMDEVSLEGNHNADLKSPKCPHCGTGGAKFKEAVQKQYEEKKMAMALAFSVVQLQITNTEATYKLAQSIYEKAAIADKKAQTDRLLLASLKAEVVRLETLACNRATWTKQLAGLTVETVDQTVIQTMAATVQTLTQEIASLDGAQKRWVAAAHEAKRAAEARQQRTALSAELVALKAITKAVEEIQSRLVAEAFSKILADANRLCGDLLLTPLAYANQEIGRWAGHVWVPHRSFSGTESLLAGCAISLALCRQSPLRILLADELGRLTVANRQRLMSRLVELTKDGFIDQAVAIDLDAAPYRDMPGVQVIEI